jgi:hypothetical protein
VISAQVKRGLRGEILKLLYENSESQQVRLDDVVLFGVLEHLHFDVHLNLVRELVKDLSERDCVKFDEEKNRRTGEVALRKIQILPRGRDIVEKTAGDPAVLVMDQ